MTAPSKPRFGTDGLRGRAGEPPLDPATLRRLGAALGIWLQQSGPDLKRVLFGNDGRESASWILEAMAQGLNQAEASSVDAGLLTTPALSLLTRAQPFAAGIMISASHNPAHDNGLKLFDADGNKLSDEAQETIANLSTQIDLAPELTGRPREQSDLANGYVEALANEFGHLDLSGATIVVDGANGGGSELAPAIFRGFGADVVEVACEPDGFNINDGCGATHPEAIAEIVKASGACLGISLDGDGDRSMFVDPNGRVRDGDDILATLGPMLKREGRLPNDSVVTTVMSNLALREVLRNEGIEVLATPVGDRHVTARMRQDGLTLGAEPSGHILFDTGDRLVGDGIYTSLKVLSLPGIVEKGAAEVFQDFERFPQILRNVTVSKKPPLEEVESIQAALREAESELGERGRVVLRYSGTEPMCRVLVEAPDQETVDRLTSTIADVVERELA
ncbi:MAG: phosphoglucosamine mutase [Planctomycetota bacterium]